MVWPDKVSLCDTIQGNIANYSITSKVVLFLLH